MMSAVSYVHDAMVLQGGARGCFFMSCSFPFNGRSPVESGGHKEAKLCGGWPVILYETVATR